MTTRDDHEAEVVICPPREDIAVADYVMRVAFGTLLGVPDPAGFFGDASWVANRWKAEPSAAFVAEMDGQVVGSSFAARWGSFAFCGPLTVRREHGSSRGMRNDVPVRLSNRHRV